MTADLLDQQTDAVGALWQELGSIRSGMTSQQDDLRAANEALRDSLETAQAELRRGQAALEAERAHPERP